MLFERDFSKLPVVANGNFFYQEWKNSMNVANVKVLIIKVIYFQAFETELQSLIMAVSFIASLTVKYIYVLYIRLLTGTDHNFQYNIHRW